LSQTFSGIFDAANGLSGFARPVSTTLLPGKQDAFVPASVAGRYKLRNGVMIAGETGRGPRGLQLESISEIGGLPIDEWLKVSDFESLTPIHPDEQIVLEPGSDSQSMRVIDLLAPIGKGQRALVVAPPRSGKTRLLTDIASAVSNHHPEMKLVVLLLDERPEEVTDMVRAVNGQVFASSNDQDAPNHIRLARLALDYAKRLVECGADVILLLDSLTRLGRSSNLAQKGPGRTLSGGVDARSLELPRKIFGAARNAEDGGSMTIVATALVETNSRMDEFIFQDFKGTGNCEIMLRRDLAELRIFPAIDVRQSATRNEDRLFGDRTSAHVKLRQALLNLSPSEAMQTLLKLIANSASNRELTENFA
jgi:transcription termination factor Rho